MILTLRRQTHHRLNVGGGSEHYRGLDVELVENIAPEILAEHIAEARENVNRAVRWLELLQQE